MLKGDKINRHSFKCKDLFVFGYWAKSGEDEKLFLTPFQMR